MSRGWGRGRPWALGTASEGGNTHIPLTLKMFCKSAAQRTNSRCDPTVSPRWEKALPTAVILISRVGWQCVNCPYFPCIGRATIALLLHVRAFQAELIQTGACIAAMLKARPGMALRQIHRILFRVRLSMDASGGGWASRHGGVEGVSRMVFAITTLYMVLQSKTVCCLAVRVDLQSGRMPNPWSDTALFAAATPPLKSWQ
mmetsp:Transcript_10792/g.26920  ORF Transcript_10792/g.26920 Transcript_10792/m.26920 type:complete len:201 (+) Transcript_10792:490-1092(+)